MTTSGGPTVAVNYWWLPPQWRSTLALEEQMKAALVEQLQQRQHASKGQRGAQETEL